MLPSSSLDKKIFNDLNDSFLYAMDIYLDKPGKTELIYDFSGEKWEDVWTRETRIVTEFCRARKMIIFQHCENWKTSGTMIKVESRTLILVEAGELIECMSYPELKMDIVQK